MASNYRTSLDDDSTIANDPIASGAPGIRTFGENAGDAIRKIETLLGTGSTTAPSASTYFGGTGTGTADWISVSLFPQQHDVSWQFTTVTSPTSHGVPWRVEKPGTILSIRLVLGTVAASGSACQVDLLKNGSTVVSTKPSITVGQQINTNTPVFSNTAVTTDDLLLPRITQGSDGVNLLVILNYRDN